MLSPRENQRLQLITDQKILILFLFIFDLFLIKIKQTTHVRFTRLVPRNWFKYTNRKGLDGIVKE
jgi:hypothetical protein